MKLSGTFIDEISHDIPHQNWGIAEWDRDFQHMQAVGINTVIMIRCGYKRQLTYGSKYLIENEGCYEPSVDLVRMFLSLSEKYNFQFFFGLYDSGKYWWEEGNFKKEVDINKYVIQEVWQQYGDSPAFKGWYLSQEVSRRTKGIIDTYAELGAFCKDISGGLPTMISPYIDGTKAILSSQSSIAKEDAVSIQQHEQEWTEILDGIQSAVDIVAFQDGHVDLHLLSDYLHLNKQLADQFKMTSWTNVESFDRDMPIKFLPIKWEKLRMKLEAAKKAGIEKAITFEFSHFMSPQSSYNQAHHLYNRYKEYLSERT